MVLVQLFFGLYGRDGGEIDVEGGDWLIVFFGNVSVEVWERVYWSICGHDDVRP